MPSAATFFAALALIFTGHLLRVWRWQLLAKPFVATRNGHYFLSLAAGYSLNALVPLRLGEVVRAWLFARLGRIPFSQALGTVAVDRAADVLVVTSLYLLGSYLGLWSISALSLLTSFILILLTVGGCVLLVRDSVWVKAPLYRFASLFNTHIERTLLALGWSTRQVLTHFIDGGPRLVGFVMLSAAMWGCYVGAIMLFASGFEGPVLLMGVSLWSELYLSSVSLPPLHSFMTGTFSPAFRYILMGFLPLAAISVYLLLRNRTRLHQHAPVTNTLRLNLFLQAEDELMFLRLWARSRDTRGLITAFRENQDVTIIKDLSGGSQARTLLVQHGGDVFYRKYALGHAEATRLEQQHAWLTAHATNLPLPQVIRTRKAEGYFSYDMPYDPSAYTFYDYVHTHSTEDSWKLLQTILNDLNSRLYEPTRSTGDVGTAETFLREKLIGPIEKSIAASPQLSELASHPTLTVNGRSVANAGVLLAQIDVPALARSLDAGKVCTPHGDLTLENIIFSPSHPHGYYLIDPLTPNIWESQYLDMGKLLQSVHVGYEFMLHLKRVNVTGTSIDFPVTTSQQYAALCARLTNHLHDAYGAKGWREIQLMELIQVARLLPYRVKHQPHAAAAYYGIFCELLDTYMRAPQAVQRPKPVKHKRKIAA